METPHLYRSLPLPNSEICHDFYEWVHISVGSPVFLGGFLLAQQFLRSKNSTKNHGVVKLQSSLPSFLHLEVWLLTLAPWQNFATCQSDAWFLQSQRTGYYTSRYTP